MCVLLTKSAPKTEGTPILIIILVRNPSNHLYGSSMADPCCAGPSLRQAGIGKGSKAQNFSKARSQAASRAPCSPIQVPWLSLVDSFVPTSSVTLVVSYPQKMGDGGKPLRKVDIDFHSSNLRRTEIFIPPDHKQIHMDPGCNLFPASKEGQASRTAEK